MQPDININATEGEKNEKRKESDRVKDSVNGGGLTGGDREGTQC